MGVGCPHEPTDAVGMKRIPLIALALAVITLIGASAAHAATYRPSSEAKVIVLINHIRAQHGLHPLTPSGTLQRAARFHSNDEMAHGYFAHDGTSESWDARIERYTKRPLIAENICYGSGGWSKPAGIVSLWMASPPHRKVILTPGLRKIGVGIAIGTFAGQAGTGMTTADFSS
jgi:uncharacterized protein YkwD